jgi:hypothetical protein
MYQFSRAIYRELAPYISEEKPSTQRESNHLRVLRQCESSVERLMLDRRYFAYPARTLFNDVRTYFTMSDQARVYTIIARNIEVAEHYFETLPDYEYDNYGAPRKCQAMTRKSTACARQPLPGSEYCPSHQHLTENFAELDGVTPLAA